MFLHADGKFTKLPRFPAASQFKKPYIYKSEIPLALLSESTRTSSLPPKLFGCVYFVHHSSPSKGRLDPRALTCVFIDYSATHTGYKCYHPPSCKVHVTMYVTFRESKSFFSFPSSLQKENDIKEEIPSFFPMSPIICTEGEREPPNCIDY